MWILNRVMDIVQIIQDEAEKEWLDESMYRDMLSELYVQLESGEIEEAEYEAIEEKILEKMREIKKYKQEHQ